MVIPSLACHLNRDKQTNESYCNGRCQFVLFQFLLQGFGKPGHTQTYPYCEGIEGTGISVIAFARLLWSLVQIKYDSNTCHEEQEEYYPELFDTSLSSVCLPEETYQSENEWQTVEHVVSFVGLQFIGKHTLVAYKVVVYKRNTGYPVTMLRFPLSLNVILSPCKVPHEVSPVHVVELIGEEELDVVPLCRNLQGHGCAALVIDHFVACYTSQPVFISLCVLVTVDTREQHVLCIYVVCLVADYFITVFFVGRGFFLTLIYRGAFFGDRHTVIAFCFQGNFRGICLSVEQRTGSILFASQIVSQGEDIFRRVLVHRSICRGANNNQCVRGISYHHHHHAKQRGIEGACTDFVLFL